MRLLECGTSSVSPRHPLFRQFLGLDSTVIERGANPAEDRDMPIYSYEELRKVSDDDLIRAHDAKGGSTEVGVAYYLDELRRRDAARQGERLEDMTRKVMWLTVCIAVFTVVITVAIVFALCALESLLNRLRALHCGVHLLNVRLESL